MHTRLALFACSSLLATQGTIVPSARPPLTAGMHAPSSAVTVVVGPAALPPVITNPVPAKGSVASRTLPPGDRHWATWGPGVAAQ